MALIKRRDAIRIRRLLGWSQYVLANHAQIDRSKLSLYENGHILLQHDETMRLEAALRNGLRSAGQTFTETLKQLSAEIETGSDPAAPCQRQKNGYS